MERGRAVICLLAGDTRTEIPIERVERLIQRPEVIRVPGAPDEVKGILEFEGQLIAAYCMDDRIGCLRVQRWFAVRMEPLQPCWRRR